MTPTPGIQVILTKLARLIVQLLGERAHCTITIQLKDGAILPVHVNRSYMPGDLPTPPG